MTNQQGGKVGKMRGNLTIVTAKPVLKEITIAKPPFHQKTTISKQHPPFTVYQSTICTQFFYH